MSFPRPVLMIWWAVGKKPAQTDALWRPQTVLESHRDHIFDISGSILKLNFRRFSVTMFERREKCDKSSISNKWKAHLYWFVSYLLCQESPVPAHLCRSAAVSRTEEGHDVERQKARQYSREVHSSDRDWFCQTITGEPKIMTKQSHCMRKWNSSA